MRALVFNAAFYLATALFMILGSPLLLGSRQAAMAGLRAHARTTVWLLRVIVGTRLEVRGLDKLPGGPALIAAKHQSTWDTIGLIPIFHDPALIMKAELLRIPLYGWFSRKFEMIAIRREAGPAALRQLLRDARERASEGRQIVIFPEGNRRAPGAPPDYKPGVVLLYEGLQLPCVPVAVNSGLFWPRRRLMKYPGVIIVEILDPIPAGVPREAFRQRLAHVIEEATARLVAEGLAAQPAAASERSPVPD